MPIVRHWSFGTERSARSGLVMAAREAREGSRMQYVDGRLVLSPTDLTKHLACAHVTTLDAAVARGELARPPEGIDEQLELIFTRGLEHEKAYLEHLRARGLSIREIPEDLSREKRQELTIAALRDGVDVVYQGAFFDGAWIGYADFLLRVDRPSDLGDFSYDIADTKLARRLKVPALLQMASYAKRLEEIQGVTPERLVVVTGDRVERPWRHLDVAAYAELARDRLRRAVETDPGFDDAGMTVTEPVPNPYCSQCRWSARCASEWAAADDLSLVAGMRMASRAKLIDAGVPTLEALAEAPAERLAVLSPAMRERLHRQARLQLQERRTGEPAYELLAPRPGEGLQRLPEPDPGDVYLDFEGDPFAEDGAGREYLAGLYDRDRRFTGWWAHDREQEAAMVRDLLAFLVERWRRFPGMHVYHYASYETVALKRLTSRYGVGEEHLDQLLRGERFVDLYAVVKQGLAISKGSYSIKKLEDFYWGRTRKAEGDQVADGMSSVVEYERWLVTHDQDILDRIRDYNEDDVRSTLDLHDWLEERRAELGERHELVRPGEVPLDESLDSEAVAAEKAMAQRLEDAGHALFAGLVGWHRREDRPEWWEFFRRADLTDDELVEDPASIGRLGPPEQVGEITGKTGRVTSRVWRYTFPPQEALIRPGDAVHDVSGTRAGVGTCVDIDPVGGWIDLKRGVRSEVLSPRGLGPGGPLSNVVLRQSLMASAEALLADEPTPAGALVARRVPRGLCRDGESPTDAVRRVGRSLVDGTGPRVLAVQGPPGAGKTYAASHLVRDLLDDGYRVGVTALSHAVIRNLLRAVGRPAIHKAHVSPEEETTDGLVELVGSNQDVEARLASGEARLVGGTAWLWARSELAGSVDVLVVDEAGQFSLANAAAVAPAARHGLVLLGDPQQLTQPTKSEHPHGAEVSALGHLIGDDPVIGPERGLFLDTTWRMHPAVTELVSDLSYDGKLTAAPGRDRQRVEFTDAGAMVGRDGHVWGAAAGGLTGGAGIRWIPVAHEGNANASLEEADAVVDLVRRVLDARFHDADGEARPMTAEDVLVVAPYNAHVAVLRAAFAEAGLDDVLVGTVDKFQGREAPVVVYALGSSSAAEAPRGVNFLFDVHRLNVAISRAKALCVVVGSPALLDAEVHTPEQLRMVNALCELVSRARRRAGEG